MDEELIDLTIEETVEINLEEVIESEVKTEDLEQSIEVEETVETVEVEAVEEIGIKIEEAVGWTGGDSTRHYSLYGRDEFDQHPITAITGLREELNDIEALDVVYSNKKGQADYYLWEDENILQENRVGYFVSACSDINEIKVCTSDNDIFGVTVDGAGFIGAQDDIARDIKYGLVVTTGVVHVRCELSVSVGDYVISNDYGYAQKNKNGYKVVGRHQIDGVDYAEITLAAPINRICKLSDDVEDVNTRMNDAETNIVAAINVANAAYNKAGEVGEVSEEAIKNALEALDKANSSSEKTDDFESRLEDANVAAVQAKKIAEDAINYADTISIAAGKTANETLTRVNDLIKDLEPITMWTDTETGNTGAEYFTTYVKDGVATKAEIQTVETLTNDNKSAIEKSAEKFTSFVSSVDKYSVGEYSQSYGLSREQAKSILKIGMIYVPTRHSDSKSHSETFTDETEPQWFTSGGYYEWNINDQGVYDWIEHKDLVAFFSEEPAPSRVLKYWYIDSNTESEGYEPYTLYAYMDDKWTKVNIFYNNPGNRMTSSISQEVDKIALEITNARGSYAGLSARLEADNEAQVAMVASVVDEEGKVTAASIVNAVTEGKSSTAITADHIVLNGFTSNADGSFQIDEDGYMIASGGTIGGWTITEDRLRKDIDLEGHQVYKKSSFVIKSGTTYHHPNDMSKADDVIVCALTKTDGTIEYPFSLWKDGTLNCTKANISGHIEANTGKFGNFLVGSTGFGDVSRNPAIGGAGGSGIWFQPDPEVGSYFINCTNYDDGSKYFRVGQDGILYATGAQISGTITAIDGYISNWTLQGGLLYSSNGSYAAGIASSLGHVNSDPAIWAGLTNWGNNPWKRPAQIYCSECGGYANLDTTNNIYWCPNCNINYSGYWTDYCNFYVTNAGHLHAESADITGTLNTGSIIADGNYFGSNKYVTMVENSTGSVVGLAHTSTNGATMQIAEGWVAMICGGTACTVWSNGTGSLQGSWVNNSGEGIKSDRNAKNTIEVIDAKYEKVYDSLIPRTFKYNDGTSGRIHTGFIAQEVEDAILLNGLTTQDMALTMNVELIDKETLTSKSSYYLRYSEFIALNTWQIQKAKARITELEDKVAKLEALIKGE